jgi:hypothetical protein
MYAFVLGLSLGSNRIERIPTIIMLNGEALTLDGDALVLNL